MTLDVIIFMVRIARIYATSRRSYRKGSVAFVRPLGSNDFNAYGPNGGGMSSERVSQLIQLMDKLPEGEADALLRQVAQKDPLLAIRIKQRHFSFSDLRYANDAGLEALTGNVDGETLYDALYSADDRLLRAFVNLMPTEEGTRFIQSVADGKPPSKRHRDIAQKTMLIKAYVLRDKGTLTVQLPGETSEFVN